MSIIKKYINSSNNNIIEYSPSAIVLFVSFNDPNTINAKNINNVKVINATNDIISVTVTQNKYEYTHGANIILKNNENIYINKSLTTVPSEYKISYKPLALGDWVFIWMCHNEQIFAQAMKSIQSILAKKKPSIPANHAELGLKFVGRITSLNLNTAVSGTGAYINTINVNATMFNELSTSVYYTYGFTSLYNEITSGIASTDIISKANLWVNALSTMVKSAYDSSKNSIAKLALDIYNKQIYLTPDLLSFLHYGLVMGLDSDTVDFSKTNNDFNLAFKGVTHHRIEVPNIVARLMGRPKAKYLWELIDTVLGIQEYKLHNKNWWEDFNPIAKRNNIIRMCPNRLRGVAYFLPSIGDGVANIYDLMKQQLNHTLNEIYTCLRVNEQGLIMPTIVIREQPYSTGLYYKMKSNDVQVVRSEFNEQPEFEFTRTKLNPSEFAESIKNDIAKKFMNFKNISLPNKLSSISFKKDTDTQGQLSKIIKKNLDPNIRTYFYNLPRWVITPNLIFQYTINFNESQRYNFIQLWGSNASAMFFGVNDPNFTGDVFRISQYNAKNYQYYINDIKRNGLSPLILTTDFDMFFMGSTDIIKVWTRIIADWYINFHLKANANIITVGITDPIVVGDNLEIEKLLYHITKVTHAFNIDTNGTKTFRTQIQAGMGVMAQSMVSKKSIPQYYCDER